MIKNILLSGNFTHEGVDKMIYYVDASGNVNGSADSNDLDAITSIGTSTYAVHIDDATAQSVTANATNCALQIQNLVAGQPNKFGLATATGTLTAVAIPSATVASNQRAAIMNKYQSQIDTARQNYWNSVSDGKTLTTQQNYQKQLTNLFNARNTELAGVTG